MAAPWVRQEDLEHAGFNVDEYVQVTELGIEKNHEFSLALPMSGK